MLSGGAMADKSYRFEEGTEVIHENDLMEHLDCEEIVIPASVAWIEEGSFAHGYQKRKIILENNPHYVCRDGFFVDKRTNCLLSYNGEGQSPKVPAGIKMIGSWAFYECHIVKLVFSSEIDDIHQDAFTTCVMEEAVFPFWQADIFFPQRDIRLRQHMLEGFGMNGMFAFDRYDEGLLAGFIEPERIKEITARLKRPYRLSEQNRDIFKQVLEMNFTGVMEELGRINDCRTLTWLGDVGILNEENVELGLEVLHSLKDMNAYVFLSEYKNRRWPHDSFDFSL